MQNYTGCGWEGEKYQRDLDIKDIAKLVKKQLKEEFPQCKFSVTIERYSGGQSLNVSLMAAPFQAILAEGNIDVVTNRFVSVEDQGLESRQYSQLNQYAFKDDYENEFLQRPAGFNNGAILSKEAWDTMKRAWKIASSYNYDDSDAMIDYFNTNFYLHLNIGKWDKPFTQIN